MPFSPFTAALAIAGVTLLISAPAGAKPAGGYYNATPATMPARANMIAAETIWKCTDGVCSARKASSRDGIVCEQVVKRVGALTTFSANGAAFDAPALAKCNARAK